MSRSDVVSNMRPSLSFSTLLIRSSAVSSCAEASQEPSLLTIVLDLAPLPFPRAAGADVDFSSARVSMAEMVHRSRKPYISRMVLWWGIASCSSASRSACITSACVDSAETMRSRILLRIGGGICEDALDSLNKLDPGTVSQVLESLGNAGTHLSKNCSVSKTELRVIASGLSATASTTGLSSLLMRPGEDSDSGSSSQSRRACGASGVGIVEGSLSNSLIASLMSNSTRESMMRRIAWREEKEGEGRGERCDESAVERVCRVKAYAVSRTCLFTIWLLTASAGAGHDIRRDCHHFRDANIFGRSALTQHNTHDTRRQTQHSRDPVMAKARASLRHIDVHEDDIKEEDPEETLDESMDPLEESGHTVDSSDEDVEDAVQEDMARFEETFVGITKRFRLINRIGEGTSHTMSLA